MKHHGKKLATPVGQIAQPDSEVAMSVAATEGPGSSSMFAEDRELGRGFCALEKL